MWLSTTPWLRREWVKMQISLEFFPLTSEALDSEFHLKGFVGSFYVIHMTVGRMLQLCCGIL